MITKSDCMSILVKLEDAGVSKALVDSNMRKLMISREIPLDVLKFISKNRGIEVANFYELLRKNHNKNKSPLYTNIVKEIDDRNEVLTTLSSMLTQIFLYSRKLENPDSFLREVRAEEITRVLNEYSKNGSTDKCVLLLKAIKSDLVVLEYIAGRRDLA